MLGQSATVVLPLDHGTVVIPHPEEAQPEIVTKHSDGELIRIKRTDRPGVCTIQRRHELNATWWANDSMSLAAAVATVTDMQAFGFRRDSESAMLNDTHKMRRGELVEIEPLDLGGIIVESEAHLPLHIHRRDDTFWRLRAEYDDSDEQQFEQIFPDRFVIEQWSGTGGSWEIHDELRGDCPVPAAAAKFAETVGFNVLRGEDISSESIEKELDQHIFWFDEATDDEFEKLARTQLGVPNKTVLFEDNVPDNVTFNR